MTDRELILELIARLGLEKQKDGLDPHYPGSNQYSFDKVLYPESTETEVIILGSGKGYADFSVGFTFDPDGKFVTHYVVE